MKLYHIKMFNKCSAEVAYNSRRYKCTWSSLSHFSSWQFTYSHDSYMNAWLTRGIKVKIIQQRLFSHVHHHCRSNCNNLCKACVAKKQNKKPVSNRTPLNQNKWKQHHLLHDDLSKIADPPRQDMQRSFYNTEYKSWLFTKNFEVSKVTKTPNTDQETGAETCMFPVMKIIWP